MQRKKSKANDITDNLKKIIKQQRSTSKTTLNLLRKNPGSK